jgi:hypothetical protein
MQIFADRQTRASTRLLPHVLREILKADDITKLWISATHHILGHTKGPSWPVIRLQETDHSPLSYTIRETPIPVVVPSRAGVQALCLWHYYLKRAMSSSSVSSTPH